MAVLQQIIKDSINGTPGTGVDRQVANTGLVLTFDAQDARNRAAYGSPTFQLTGPTTIPAAATGNLIHAFAKGVLGDYHNHRQISVIRKGRVKLQAHDTPAESSIGQKVFAYFGGRVGIATAATGGSTAGTDHVGSDPDAGFGEIVGIDVDSNAAANYYIVDINFPEN